MCAWNGEDVRAFAHAEPDTFFAESMTKPDPGMDAETVKVRRKQSMWHSEMYGYVFAASEAGFKHILTDGVVVYPDDIGAGRVEEASIIHYGLHCQVEPRVARDP